MLRLLSHLTGILLLFALPAGVRARISAPRAGDSLLRPAGGEIRNRLSPLVAEVIPPAYTGEKHVSLDEPSSVEVLAGSHLVLRGRGAATGITAALNSTPLSPALLRDSADQWRLDIVAPAKDITTTAARFWCATHSSASLTRA